MKTIQSFSILVFVSFLVIVFLFPLQLLYSQYKLDIWTTAERLPQNSAYFANLSSGEYTYHVMATNSDDVWDNKGASITFVIKLPFWETWYFRAFAVCSILFIGYLLYHIQERQRKRIIEKQQIFTRALIDSTEAERKRIASELHDSLGQELLIIKNRALLALSDLKNKRNIREQLGEISDVASQAIQETREISYNLRPYQIDRLGLRRAIESIINRVSRTSTIKFISEIDPIDGLLAKEFEIHVYRIVQECVNNILKHASATEGRLSIKKDTKTLLITVEDNGVGFDVKSEESHKSEKHGLGLFGISERARLLGGSMKLESSRGAGTRLRVSITLQEQQDATN